METHSTFTTRPVGVSVRAVTKSYGTQRVLNGIDLQVEPGETFVIMGPSGAGKTVLLRQIIGLEHPDSGEVLIDGGNAADPATHARVRTAIVFQAGALFNSMTVFDNLALYPREHRLHDEKTIARKVRAALDALHIGAAANKIPAELSGGMRKRVAVARALVMEPQVILYDEPTSELDPVMAANTAELIATVGRDTGATSIVITHDRSLASGIAHRVAMLMDGRITFTGTPAQLATATDPRIRDFMNPAINLDQPRFKSQEESAS